MGLSMLYCKLSIYVLFRRRARNPEVAWITCSLRIRVGPVRDDPCTVSFVFIGTIVAHDRYWSRLEELTVEGFSEGHPLRVRGPCVVTRVIISCTFHY